MLFNLILLSLTVTTLLFFLVSVFSIFYFK